MNRLFRPLLIIIISFTSTIALADGHYLLDRCETALQFSEHQSKYASRADMAYCFGLLQGIRDLNRLYQHKLGNEAYFCLGQKHLSHSDAAQIVVDYLKAHPNHLSKPETSLAVQALRARFPCPETTDH